MCVFILMFICAYLYRHEYMGIVCICMLVYSFTHAWYMYMSTCVHMLVCAFICLYLHMYIYICLHMHFYVLLCMFSPYSSVPVMSMTMCTCVNVNVCIFFMHVQFYVCLCAWIRMCIHASCVCSDVLVCTYVYLYMGYWCICTFVFLCVFAYVHTCICVYSLSNIKWNHPGWHVLGMYQWRKKCFWHQGS